MSLNNGNYGGNLAGSYNQSFVCLLSKYIGETVTIFTTSGGASGCGFSGVLLSVNCEFVRLSTLQGTPPANPLAQNICPRLYGVSGENTTECKCHHKPAPYTLGSVCDIPVCAIASFCHNAV